MMRRGKRWERHRGHTRNEKIPVLCDCNETRLSTSLEPCIVNDSFNITDDLHIYAECVSKFALEILG